MIYAVIDTNVIVSALITKNANSPVVEIMKKAFAGEFKLLINESIFAEYREVLGRPKFGLDQDRIDDALSYLSKIAISIEVPSSGVILPDLKDAVFYDVALFHQDKKASLVTGNIKHFPNTVFAVTPREFLDKLKIEEELNKCLDLLDFPDSGLMLNDCRAAYCC